MKQATDSQMAMFRGIIALAWADHVLEQAEKDQLIVFIDANVHLSDAQRVQLKNEIDNKADINKIWPLITDVHDRAHLINVATVIFWNDSVFCEQEKELYEMIQEKHMLTIDSASVEKDIRAMAEMFRLQRTAREETAKGDSKIRRILRYLGEILP